MTKRGKKSTIKKIAKTLMAEAVMLLLSSCGNTQRQTAIREIS
jgi:hypothetical protein